MNEFAIKVDNISKVYKLYNKPADRLKESLNIFKKKYHEKYNALENVSFEVKKGEIFGIVGVNGAGKSTLLKIITGVLTQSEGSIICQGKISALLELGAGFNGDYTGIENVYLNGTMMGYSKQEMDKKLESIVSFADIGQFINQPVKTYSSGMFARLAFSVSINVDPDILIVDEALSVGDVFFQAKCYKKFEEIKSKGKTILFVSHDIGSIIKYCDRAILLNKGKVCKIGKTSEVVDEYKKVLVKTNELSNPIKTDLKNHVYNKDKLLGNPNFITYGNDMAEIIDFALLNNENVLTNKIYKDSACTFKMMVKFNNEIKDPIFAYTIKDVKGTEIVGTNTMIEKIDTKTFLPGDVVEISFSQKLILQGGNYLISFGCTGFENDNFVVYHRLYDVTFIEIISDKNTVGYFDIHSVISLNKICFEKED